MESACPNQRVARRTHVDPSSVSQSAQASGDDDCACGFCAEGLDGLSIGAAPTDARTALDDVRWTGLEDLRPDVRGHVARHTAHDADIEDVVQETLLRAARYRDSLEDPRRLKPWVLRIALNVLRDRRRRDLRLPRVEEGGEVLELVEGRESIPGDLAEPLRTRMLGAVVERQLLFDHLFEALGRMREDERRALGDWCTFERDGPVPQRADGAGVSCVRETPAVPKQRVFRARRRLMQLLKARIALDPELERARAEERSVRARRRNDA